MKSDAQAQCVFNQRSDGCFLHTMSMRLKDAEERFLDGTLFSHLAECSGDFLSCSFLGFLQRSGNFLGLTPLASWPAIDTEVLTAAMASIPEEKAIEMQAGARVTLRATETGEACRAFLRRWNAREAHIIPISAGSWVWGFVVAVPRSPEFPACQLDGLQVLANLLETVIMRVSTRFQAEIIDEIGDAMVVSTVGFELLWSNHAFTRLLGFSSEELRALTLRGIIPPHMEAAIAEGNVKLPPGETRRRKMELLHRNGEHVPLDVVIRKACTGGQDVLISLMRDLRPASPGHDTGSHIHPGSQPENRVPA